MTELEAKGGSTTESMTLDDIAALLVQLEPNDISDLAAIRARLDALADDPAVGNPAIRKLLREAAKKIAVTIDAPIEEAAPALASACRLVTAASSIQRPSDHGPGLPAPAEMSDGEVAAVAAGPVVQAPPPPEPVAEAGAPPEKKKHSAHVVLCPPDVDMTVVGEFVTECLDYIASAEGALLSLENDPYDKESIDTVFRAFHTIKGVSAMLEMTAISHLAHQAESLLSPVRDGSAKFTATTANLSLRSVDMIKACMDKVQEALNGGSVSCPDGYDDLLHELAHPEVAAKSGGVAQAPTPAAPPPPPAPPPAAAPAPPPAAAAPAPAPVAAPAAAHAPAPVAAPAPAPVAAAAPPPPPPPAAAPAAEEGGEAKKRPEQRKPAESAVESSIRVRTDRLDRLIDLVGELVIAHSMVAQDDTLIHGANHDLVKKVTHTGKIVRELQDLSMSLRMVPLKSTFQNMQRVVRDVARKCGKLVDFVTDGEDTEIDRNMANLISDPLVHMVRNSVDHGIELPEVREKNGKNRSGRVRLAAYHASGNVIVELSDDGGGLDRDKIFKRAVDKGLVDPNKVLSDNEVYNIIFEPGFSTKEAVTDVSGRGVGMDVVRRNIEALKGRIEITSQLGTGTTFLIYLPLTLAVTDGMLVRVGNERYIVPTVSINMSLRPEQRQLSTVSGRGEMLILRGSLIPIFRLHRLFEIDDAVEDPTQGLVVIVNDGGQHCGLLVDELLGQRQVVAKTLGAGLGRVEGVSGGAILGDGRVGLILDPAGIVNLARHSGLI
jgi:two-component system chemotaxis sensor kinase CheA